MDQLAQCPVLGNATHIPVTNSAVPKLQEGEGKEKSKVSVLSQSACASAVTTRGNTAFERLTYALQHEPRFAEEVALGRRVGAYKFIKDIGRGNFSKVKLATHQLTRDNVAVKIVDRSRLDSRAQRMLSSEVVTLESLHHPNVLRLFEVIEMWNRVYIITEFIAGGELYNKISLEGPVREPHAAVLFKQLLDAVQYMVSFHFCTFTDGYLD